MTTDNSANSAYLANIQRLMHENPDVQRAVQRAKNRVKRGGNLKEGGDPSSVTNGVSCLNNNTLDQQADLMHRRTDRLNEGVDSALGDSKSLRDNYIRFLADTLKDAGTAPEIRLKAGQELAKLHGWQVSDNQALTRIEDADPALYVAALDRAAKLHALADKAGKVTRSLVSKIAQLVGDSTTCASATDDSESHTDDLPGDPATAGVGRATADANRAPAPTTPAHPSRKKSSSFTPSFCDSNHE